ncbi:MAG TPA: hypothetical protein VNB24_06725 [Acidimicrobiales bacterium]|nr:hypothetical protein [Acidimicrobiales bacterium]
MRIRRTLVAAGLLAAATAAAIPSGAGAANLVVVSANTAQGYILPATPLFAGMGLDYTNIDPLAAHNVVSDVPGLFSSGALITAGQTRNVAGVEDLEPGTYGFFCKLHTNMKGSLVVLPVADPTAGDPPPAPDPNAGAPGTPGGVPTPTAITVFDGAMYAASYGTNSIYKLPILPGGQLGVATTYATGFNSPLGIVFDENGTLYVSDSHTSNRSRAADGRVWRIPPGGGDAAAVGTTVIDGLPNGRHNTNNLAIHEGRLYITNGNATDDGTAAGGDAEEHFSGTLLSVALDTTGVLIESPADRPAELVLEAEGMRNLYDVAFRPGTDEAWIPTNGPDALDPFGEDALHVADVTGAAPDFGFPSCVFAPANTPGGTNAGAFSWKQNPAITEGCDAGATHALPEQLLGLHTSADGLAFNPTGTELYVALFGNFFGEEVVGHKVVKMAIDAAGNAGPVQDVVSLSAAPLDVAWGPAGLYVADFASGQITLVR